MTALLIPGYPPLPPNTCGIFLSELNYFTWHFVEVILKHLQRYLETPRGVTNLRLKVIALNKEVCYISPDILGGLKNVYAFTPNKNPGLPFQILHLK